VKNDHSQSEPQSPDPHAPEPIVPDRLAREIRDLARVDVIVPSQIEDDLHAEALRRLSPRNVRRLRFGRGLRRAAPLAAAAGLAMTAWVGFRAFNTSSSGPGPMVDPAPFLAMDLDASGRIDILDAFLIARTIRAGGPLQGAWDVTGDNAVDQRDADAIAAAAVSLTVSSSS
jgi:Dockerin type I domain